MATIEKPQKIGKYVVQDVLGKGGMGIVYKAYDPILDRIVAIKMMVSAGADDELRERFYREAQAIGTLRHPNVITIYDLGQEGPNPYIAMEFLTGTDLDKIIKSRQSLDMVRKLDIIRQVSDGLHAAHQAGVTHRDVKPANIRVLDDGLVKIMDFGIARMSTSATMTRSGLIMGTVHYMSPEQVKGVKVDGRSDIFSVGVVLYELLAYHKPFHADTMTSVLYKIVNEPPPSLSSLGVEAPAGLESILKKALSKEITTRYQDISLMSRDLLGLIGELHRAEQLQGDQKHINSIIEEGKTLIGTAQYQEAQEVLHQVLTMAPDHQEANALLEAAEREWQRAWTGQLLAEGKEMLRGEFYEDAQLRFHEVLAMDPANGEAAALLDKAQRMEEQERLRAQSIIEAKRRERLELERATEYQEFERPVGAAVTTRRLRVPRRKQAIQLPPPIPEAPVEEEPLQTVEPLPPDEPMPELQLSLVERLGGPLAVAVFLGALILLIVALWLVFRPSPRQQAPVEQPPGSASLTILPWARIEQITDLADGKAVQGIVPLPIVTPCAVQLPAGRYRLEATNPLLGTSKVFEIEVTSNSTTPFVASLDGYSPEQALTSLLP